MRRLLIAAAALAMSVPAWAADSVPKATQDFIDKASVANQFEIDTSQLALQYAKGDDVKTFAKEMIEDHTKVGEDFKAALTSANIPLPKSGLDLSHKAKYAKLRVFTTEKGFDSSYISEQLSAHQDAVALFKEHAASDPTPAVKTFAAATLPKLEHHLEMVKALSSKYTQ